MKNKALCAIAFDFKSYQDPAAFPPGQVGLYAIGFDPDGAMYYRHWVNNVWSDWLSLGGKFDSSPLVSQQDGQYSPDALTHVALGLNHRAVINIDVGPFVAGPGVVPEPPGWSADWAELGAAGVEFAGPLDVTGPIVGVENTVLALVGRGVDSRTCGSNVFSFETDQWSDWIPLEGLRLISEPVIALQGTVLRIFGVGLDRQMYLAVVDVTATVNYDPDIANPPPPPRPALSAWQAVGQCFSSDPAVVMWDEKRIDVFGVGFNKDMLHRAMENGAWIGDWESLGGLFDSPPAVVSWAPNRLDIFGLGIDDKMYHKSWDNGWSPSLKDWEPLGCPSYPTAAGGRLVLTFNSAPVAVSGGVNNLHVFAIETDGHIWRKMWNGGPEWSDWEDLIGPFKIFNPAQLLPSRLDFDWQISSGDVTGSVHVTLFKDGASSFSGHIHDSGFDSYAESVGYVIVDGRNRAYTFEANGHMYGTDLPGSRDFNWNTAGVASLVLRDNWADLFPCGGAKSEGKRVSQSIPPGGLVHMADEIIQDLGGAAAFTIVPLVTS